MCTLPGGTSAGTTPTTRMLQKSYWRIFMSMMFLLGQTMRMNYVETKMSADVVRKSGTREMGIEYLNHSSG